MNDTPKDLLDQEAPMRRYFPAEPVRPSADAARAELATDAFPAHGRQRRGDQSTDARRRSDSGSANAASVPADPTRPRPAAAASRSGTTQADETRLGRRSTDRQPGRQEELLRITCVLMADKGMHQMTLQDVADAAATPKANIVYHYKTKENLVLAAMEWVLKRVAGRVVHATASAEGSAEKIRSMIDAIFIDPQRYRAFHIVYTELIAHSSRSGRFAALNGWFREIVTGEYAAVIDDTSGWSKKSLAESAKVVRALIDGLFLQWLEEPDWEARHSDYKELCARSIIAFLGGQESQQPRTSAVV